MLATLVALAGCSLDADPDPTPSGSLAAAAPTATPMPTPSPTPTPTPAPTPAYTNAPDPDLLALIPEAAGGVALSVPAIEEFGLTPGDIGEVFGAIGLHFRSLAIAYIEQPRLSFYAMRMDAPVAVTEQLEPQLAEIGRYVGIAGLDPEPWELHVVAGREVWARPEDNATAAGTMIYTWIADDIAFLLIGVDDAVNQALIAELPGVPPPTPSASGSAVPSSEAPVESPPG